MTILLHSPVFVIKLNIDFVLAQTEVVCHPYCTTCLNQTQSGCLDCSTNPGVVSTNPSFPCSCNLIDGFFESYSQTFPCNCIFVLC